MTKNVDSWEKFFEYWEKEADEIRNKMLTPKSCSSIRLRFMADYLDQKVFVHRGGFDFEAHTRYRILESKLNTSLEIAESNYLDKHPPLSEKFVDSLATALGKIIKK